MAITKYEENGKCYWRVYVDIRNSKNKRIRIQKRINSITSKRDARAKKKKLIHELSEKVFQEELKGSTWQEVIDRWELYQNLYPSKKLSKLTVIDYAARLRNWTTP